MVTEIDNLHSAIFPVYIICKILAITPYSLQGTPDCYKLAVTKQDLIIKLTQNVLLSAYYIHVESNHISAIRQQHILDILTEITEHFILLLLIICSLACFYIYRKEIFNILTNLTDIEKELRQMDIAVNYKDVRRFCLIQTTMRLCLVAVWFGFNIFDLGSDIPILMLILYCIIMAITTMNICYLLVLLYDIRYKYSLINAKLQQMFSHLANISLCQLSDNIRISDSSERSNDVVLKNLIIIHGRLYDLCRTINVIYNVYFVLILLTCFTGVVTGGYCTMNNLDIKEIDISGIISECIWTVYNIAQVLILVQNIQACCTQANQTVIIMNDMRYNTCNSALKEWISTFAILLNHHKLKFTAYGLFTIDNTLLYMMTAAVSTYLIILYQFKNDV